jgi:hypothetical protein
MSAETTNLLYVKQITIGNDTRDIAAKYDYSGKAIADTYVSQDVYDDLASQVADHEDVISECVTKTDLKRSVSEVIGEMMGDDSSEISVKLKPNKRISYQTELSSLSFTIDEKYNKLLKFVIYKCEGNSNKFKIDLNKGDSLDFSFLNIGSTFEIYDKILIAKNAAGDVEVVVSDTSWSVLQIIPSLKEGEESTTAPKFEVMVYEEG